MTLAVRCLNCFAQVTMISLGARYVDVDVDVDTEYIQEIY